MASTPGPCRLTSSGPVVVSPAILSADTAPNHPMRVDRPPGLGACWSPTRWLGEGSTVVANAEQAKDAAEADRSGDPLVYDLKEVANRVEGAMA